MAHYLQSIEQRIGDVTLGDGATANVGIFHSYHGSEKPSAQQALSFPEVYNRLHEIPDATSGTCSWVLKNSKLRSWQNARCGLLWIKGKPGTGKSTIMKYMEKHFSLESSRTQITASFFCHGQGVDLQKSCSGVFRALLHQIVDQVPQLNEDLEKKFQARCKTQGPHGSAWKWTESELRNFTRDCFLSTCCNSDLLIFVDALDECGEDSARELLDFFESTVTASEAQSGSRLKICISSRHYPLVRSDVLYEVIVDSENLADIRTYIAQKLEVYRKSIRSYDELLSTIASKAGEIFQWCTLVVARVIRSLERKKPEELILHEIQETPQELFKLYRQIVRTAMNDTNVSSRDKKQFFDVMQWVALAKYKLSVRMLEAVLTINDSDQTAGHPYKDKFPATDFEYLSYGLISVEKDPSRFDHDGSPLVQFIHFSVQEYFVGGQGLRDLRGLRDPDSAATAKRTAELDIVRTCYQSILRFEPHLLQHEQYLLLHEQYPLQAYAHSFMFAHARSAEEGWPVQKDLAQILNFPEDNFLERLGMVNPGCMELGTLLHLAAFHNVPNLISSVLNLAPGLSINVRTGRRNKFTALHVAACDDSHDAVRRLLDISQDCKSDSTLRRNQGSRILDIDARDSSGATPLMIAAGYGHSKMVEQLFLRGRADLNKKDRKQGFTALHHAIKHWKWDTAKILVQHGASPLILDSSGWDPLRLTLKQALTAVSEAHRAGAFSVFWYMLSQTSEQSYPGMKFKAQWLLRGGLESPWSLEFAQGLLGLGLDPHAPDYYDDVCISYLGHQSNPKTLDLLQTLPGADYSFKSHHGRALLARLASSDSADCAMLTRLLQHPEVDVCKKDRHGKTPLIIAAQTGSIEVVKLLLADARSDPQARDNKNMSALDYARKRRNHAQDALQIAEATKSKSERKENSMVGRIFGWKKSSGLPTEHNKDIQELARAIDRSRALLTEADEIVVLLEYPFPSHSLPNFVASSYGNLLEGSQDDLRSSQQTLTPSRPESLPLPQSTPSTKN